MSVMALPHQDRVVMVTREAALLGVEGAEQSDTTAGVEGIFRGG